MRLDEHFKWFHPVEGEETLIDWTYRDEVNDIFDMLENYLDSHQLYPAPGELVRELRGLISRLT